MTYTNKDRYLSLKQQLVCLQLVIMKCAITHGDEVNVEREQLVESIRRSLTLIEEDYSVPYAFTRDIYMHYDLKEMANAITDTCKYHSPESSIWERIPVSTDVEGLHRTVFEFPVFNIITDIVNKNVANDFTYGNTRKHGGELIQAVDLAFKTITYWIAGECSTPIGQLLALVNMIELADWYTEFCNDKYSSAEVINEQA